MNVKPFRDHILIKRVEAEEMVKGGIIIPDSAKEKPMEGKVIAVGTGKVAEDGKLQPLTVKPGERVLVGKYSGTEIKIEGEDHVTARHRRLHQNGLTRNGLTPAIPSVDLVARLTPKVVVEPALDASPPGPVQHRAQHAPSQIVIGVGTSPLPG